VLIVGNQYFSTDPPNIKANVILDNIFTKYPHISRDNLVKMLFDRLILVRIVHIASPMGSGKTSIMNLFAHHYSESVECLYHSLLNQTPQDALEHAGVQPDGRLSITLKDKCDDHLVVIMLDDCQKRYTKEYTNFWEYLIKNSNGFHENLTFIMCSTRSLITAEDSPAVFTELATLQRNDFLLTDDEALSLIRLEPPTGLALSLRYDVVEAVMIKECNGLVAALRISITHLNKHFSDHNPVNEEEVLQAYFSAKLVPKLDRCFTYRGSIAGQFHQFLVGLMTRTTQLPVVEDDKELYERLVKCGVLAKFDGAVGFASPLASRYITSVMFPDRCAPENSPKTLELLIVGAIKLWSANSLRKSVAQKGDTCKEAVYQHQLLHGLHQLTSASSSICPELSRVFPDVNTSSSQATATILGALDFYINGTSRWGIELLINGDRIQEHWSRVAQGGKYARLNVKDYIVVDFRVGVVTHVKTAAHLMTVFFAEDFKNCTVIFNGISTPVTIGV